jgi:hypothetical protein
MRSVLARLTLPSLAGWIWLGVFLAGTLGPQAASFVSGDGDLALHLLLGDLIRESGWVLATEPTTFTASDRPFVAHEWLSEVMFSGLHELFGLHGPLMAVAALLATTLVVILRRCLQDGASAWPAVFAVLGATLVAHNHLIARPHAFSWLLATLWWLQLEDLHSGRLTLRRFAGAALPMLVLWTNLHGGFVTAFFLLGLFGLGELAEAVTAEPTDRGSALHRFFALVGLGVAGLVVSGLNPFGFSLHLHILGFMNTPGIVDHVAEFVSPDFHDPAEKLFLLWALGVFSLMMAGRRRPAAWEWTLVLGLFTQALVAVRGEPVFAFLTAPLVARRLEGWLQDLRGSPSWAGAASRAVLASSLRLGASDQRVGGFVTVPAAAGLGVALVATGWVAPLQFDPRYQPTEAVQFVRSQPELFEGRMFNHYSWGGYLAYELYPGRRTFINSFNDHYGPELFAEYRRVEMLAPDWREILEQYEIDWVFTRTHSVLTRALIDEDIWKEVYADELATILVRIPQVAELDPSEAPGPMPPPGV